MINLLGLSAIFLTLPAHAGAPRDIWLKDFRVDIGDSVCKEGSYFRKCFSETAQECAAISNKAFDFCSNRYKKKMPPELEKKEFDDWRAKIKLCMGASMSISLEDAKKAKQSDDCNPKNDNVDSHKPISADQYLEQMAISLPQDLCFDGMPHRTCYDVTEEECRKGVSKAIEECSPSLKNELPSHIRLSENQDWDMDVLECLAPKFDAAYAAKKQTKIAFCKDAITSLREKKKKREEREKKLAQ